MNPLEQILQSLLGAGGTTADWLWCIEEGALQRHIATRQPVALSRVYGQQTGEDLTEIIGDTAVIQVHGVMMKQIAWSDEVSTLAIEQAIRAAAGNHSVRSILLDIDSPGGSAAGLVQLAAAVAEARAQKPIQSQSTGMIASAAYFLAAGTDKIYASRGDLIGSIGTRLHVFDFSQLFENIGVKSIPIDTGPLKSTGAFGTKLSEEQIAYLQTIVDGFQTEFTDVVMRGRGFTAEQFASVATGGVFHVAESRRLGLIDGIRTKTETLAAMPKRKSSSTQRTKAMSEQTATAALEETAATMPQLKKAFPKASSDFLVAQLEQEATLTEAHQAYSEHLEAENQKLVEANAKTAEELVAANERAEKAAKGTSAGQVRGNKPGTAGTGTAADSEPVNYKGEAEQLMKERNCSYREACHLVKKKYGVSARDAFKGSPLKG